MPTLIVWKLAMTRRTLALATLAAFLLMACTPDKPAAPAATVATSTTFPAEDGPEPERAATLALENGEALIRATVVGAERRGGLHVVRFNVENVGKRPVATMWLLTEIEDDQGRRFEMEIGSTSDTPGTLNPTEAGVLTVRFKLPVGAVPKVLYVAEVGGGEPAPILVP